MVAFPLTLSDRFMALDAGADAPSKEVMDQEYPSTLESVDAAESEILKAAEHAGFEEDELHQIGMAVRECMVNAVVHGNRYNRNKKVRVKVSVATNRMSISIIDQGEGFEVQEVPDPLHDNNLLRHSGRGLFLMGAFMDDVSVHKADPVGTEVVLVKKLVVK
jgi:serine/threonine-protein kinase RsbW